MTMTETEKPSHYLVSQYRYPDGDQARFEDTASRYLTDLAIDGQATLSPTDTLLKEVDDSRKRFLSELEILAAAADPNWTP